MPAHSVEKLNTPADGTLCATEGHIVRSGESGFSVIELSIVCAIIVILTGMTLFAFAPHRNAYRTDDEAYLILDFMRDAGGRAIANRITYRVEVDLTKNTVQMISENNSTTPTTYTLVRSATLDTTTNVRVDRAPTGLTPPNPPNYPAAVYAASTCPVSVGDNVWAIRFKRDSTVCDPTDVPTNATLFIWPPSSSSPNSAQTPGAIRAITVFGTGGGIKYWGYNGSAFVAR